MGITLLVALFTEILQTKEKEETNCITNKNNKINTISKLLFSLISSMEDAGHIHNLHEPHSLTTSLSHWLELGEEGILSGILGGGVPLGL